VHSSKLVTAVECTFYYYVRIEKLVVSRVLYSQVVITGLSPPTAKVTIIYLGHALLRGSSDQPERASS